MSHLVTTFLTCRAILQEQGEYVIDRVARRFSNLNFKASAYFEIVPEKGPLSFDVLLLLRDGEDEVVWGSAVELVLIQHSSIELTTMIEPEDRIESGSYALDLLIDGELRQTRLLYLDAQI
ncbi:MAG: hypothetical protein IT462_04000 [Planctomycetes bacterium]|nr:hypothetical protein [Planctomycetota bacterium]